MLRNLASVAVCLLGLAGAPLGAQTLGGALHVIDGDTVHVGDWRVRLHGIDAPETGQFCGGAGTPMWDCGGWVRREVAARYAGQIAICDVLDTDRYGRAVARCRVDGVDLGRALVQDGLAFADRRYAMDYDLEEKAAAVDGRGLHAAHVQLPRAFRAALQRGRAAQWAPKTDCVIKGNLSDGRRIYHLPGQAWYDRTRIDPAKGEHWFCSEAEAQDAGWRKARR